MLLRPLVLFCCLIFFCPASWAQVTRNFLTDELPQYEIGAGIIGLDLPQYPGSRNNRLRAVPFPYYIYRGKYLRADDEGTRARLLTGKRYETGLSFGFNFPVNSNDIDSRQGMPNLDALVSFGPRLLLRLLADNPSQRLNFSFAARAVFSSKVSFNNLLRAEGMTFEPRLSYWYRWQKSETTFFASAGVEFGSAKYARFFYNVDPQFSATNRPAYLARAGIIESSMSIGAGQVINRRWFAFGGLSWRNLDSSANKESPLVETTNNVGVIFGLVWTFFESEAKVQRL